MRNAGARNRRACLRRMKMWWYRPKTDRCAAMRRDAQVSRTGCVESAPTAAQPHHGINTLRLHGGLLQQGDASNPTTLIHNMPSETLEIKAICAGACPWKGQSLPCARGNLRREPVSAAGGV